MLKTEDLTINSESKVLPNNVLDNSSSKSTTSKNKEEKNFRNVLIRVAAVNKVTKDNPKLGVKAGDVVTYTESDIYNILCKWSKSKKKMKYYFITHDEDTNNIHYHIVIECDKNSEVKFKTVKNKFPYGFIDEPYGGVRASVQYLIHMNNPEKFQYDWSKVHTNAPSKLEGYKRATAYGVEIQAKWIIDQILAGKIKEYEIKKIPPELYIKYKRKFFDAFDYRQKIIAENPNRKLNVFVLQGPPRVGKSLFTKVFAEKYGKSICFSSASNDPFSSYFGQDAFVYDDYNYKNVNIEDMLKVFDPHNLTTVSARYKNRLFVGDTIFVCTNEPIESWYTWASDSHRKALFARISCVMQFGELENGIVQYTLNNIVESGQIISTDNEGIVTGAYTKMELARRDDKVYKFDLTKYVDITEDTKKTDEYIEMFKAL